MSSDFSKFTFFARPTRSKENNPKAVDTATLPIFEDNEAMGSKELNDGRNTDDKLPTAAPISNVTNKVHESLGRQKE
jgi:hypothetical protein